MGRPPVVLMLGFALPALGSQLLPPAVRLRGGIHDVIRGGAAADEDDRPVDAAEDEPLISRASGRIELITGPMFSGKSTELLRRLSRYQAAKVPLVLLKFSGDDRYSSTEVQTHDRNAMSALAVVKHFNVVEDVGPGIGSVAIGLPLDQFPIQLL